MSAKPEEQPPVVYVTWETMTEDERAYIRAFLARSAPMPETWPDGVKVEPVTPPLNYVGPRGESRRIGDAAPWPGPLCLRVEGDGHSRYLAERLIGPKRGEVGANGRRWISMGYVQWPDRPGVNRALAQIAHGLLVGYPLWSVLAFAWRWNGPTRRRAAMRGARKSAENERTIAESMNSRSGASCPPGPPGVSDAHDQEGLSDSVRDVCKP